MSHCLACDPFPSLPCGVQRPAPGGAAAGATGGRAPAVPGADPRCAGAGPAGGRGDERGWAGGCFGHGRVPGHEGARGAGQAHAQHHHPLCPPALHQVCLPLPFLLAPHPHLPALRCTRVQSPVAFPLLLTSCFSSHHRLHCTRARRGTGELRGPLCTCLGRVQKGSARLPSFECALHTCVERHLHVSHGMQYPGNHFRTVLDVDCSTFSAVSSVDSIYCTVCSTLATSMWCGVALQRR